MLFGITFLSHQVGGSLGVYLGGLLYETTGSYNIVWWGGVAVRRAVGADQSADRREAGAAARAGARCGVIQSRGIKAR